VNAGPLHHTCCQTFPFEGSSTKVRVQAIKGLLVKIYNHNLVAPLEQVIA